MIDFNDAPEQRGFELIPTGTIVPVQMTIRPGNAGDAGWLKRSNTGECLMIDAEFIVLDGKYAKRKFWTLMTVDGQTEGQKKAVEISVSRIRAILESAHGIKPSDDSADAAKSRRISSYAELDGIRFWASVGIEKGKEGYKDKNVLQGVVTPDRSDWSKLDQVKTGGGNATASNSAGNTSRPAWA